METGQQESRDGEKRVATAGGCRSKNPDKLKKSIIAAPSA